MESLCHRHSYCSRFLYTVVPSEMYASDTLDTLLYALVEDLERLYKEGLEVTCQITMDPTDLIAPIPSSILN